MHNTAFFNDVVGVILGLRGAHMRRREFITLAGGAAIAWPHAARAQRPMLPVVASIAGGSPEADANLAAAFRKGSTKTSYAEGQNVTVEYHWLEGQYNGLPALMADLVRRGVAVIATPASRPASLVAKATTTTIPIIFGVAADPVQLGSCRQPRPTRRQRDRHRIFWARKLRPSGYG